MAKYNRQLVPIIFTVKRSSILIIALALLHLLAMIAAYLNTLDISFRLVIISLIVMNLLVKLKHELQVQAVFIRSSSLKGWEITSEGGEFSAINILPSTVITPYFIFLHFKAQKKPRESNFILKDSMVEDEFRQLIVQLRIAGLKKLK